MKKTYINPEIAVVKIATHQMLAASGPAIFDELGGHINLDPTVELDPNAGDEVLSRELDDFDDDEEEDF